MYKFFKKREKEIRETILYKNYIKPIKYKVKYQFKKIYLSIIKKSYILLPYSTAEKNCSHIDIIKKGKNKVTIPVFFNENKIFRNQIEIIEPEISINIFENASAISGTSLIIKDDKAFHPDVFLPHKHVSPSEVNGYIDYDDTYKVLNTYINKNLRKKEGIILFGMITENWAHWLLEVLPKLILIDQHGIDKKIPIYIDSNVHENFIQSLKLINSNKREIHYIKKWTRVDFEKLVFISNTSFTPPFFSFYFKNKVYPYPSKDNHIFSKHALSLFKKTVIEKTNSKYNYKKIYIHRSDKNAGNKRPITNLYYIETLAMQKGYIKLDPGDYNFEEQAEIFMNAEKIISPVGASLVNTIFCKNKCKILALTGSFYRADHYYFSNLMGILGHELYLLKSKFIKDTSDSLNITFEYEEKDIFNAINFFDDQ